MRRPATALAFMLASFHPGAGSRGEDRQHVAPETLDCGTLALYQLLQIEHRPVTWEAVLARLDPPPQAGHSMKELHDAAKKFGMELTGVKLAMIQEPLDRPGIVFVKRGTAGHFLVVRPVGTSNKLVQILDGVQPPEVVDIVELESLPGWTGLALLPERANRIKNAITLFMIAIASVVAARLGLAARRRKLER